MQLGVASLLIFDGDNTLWDTNAVFLNAQIAMLRPFTRYRPSLVPHDEIGTLREVDRAFHTILGQFEYDFRLLAIALYHIYASGVDIHDAAQIAISGTPPDNRTTVEEAFQYYTLELAKIPEMLPETESVLSELCGARSGGNDLTLALFSEGNEVRLNKILEAHNLLKRKMFDLVYIGAKSKAAFASLKDAVEQKAGDTRLASTVVIGDALRREIRIGNRIGATTVYIPAGFMGIEQPTSADEEPTYNLSRIGLLPDLLRDLGVL